MSEPPKFDSFRVVRKVANSARHNSIDSLQWTVDGMSKDLGTQRSGRHRSRSGTPTPGINHPAFANSPSVQHQKTAARADMMLTSLRKGIQYGNRPSLFSMPDERTEVDPSKLWDISTGLKPKMVKMPECLAFKEPGTTLSGMRRAKCFVIHLEEAPRNISIAPPRGWMRPRSDPWVQNTQFLTSNAIRETSVNDLLENPDKRARSRVWTDTVMLRRGGALR